MREQGLEPRFFCGGGWYTDDGVREAVRELGLVDCTQRGGARLQACCRRRTRSESWRAPLLRPLPGYVHAYFHDYDLVDPVRRRVLAARRSTSTATSGAGHSRPSPQARPPDEPLPPR